MEWSVQFAFTHFSFQSIALVFDHCILRVVYFILRG